MIERKIWIARHANRLDFEDLDWFNDAEFPYDPPLAKSGFLQAQRLSVELTKHRIDHIFSSPYLRSIQTADPVAEKLQLPIKIENGLREWLHQDWTKGMPVLTPINSLWSRYPNIEKGYKSLINPRYPETEAEVLERSRLTIEHIITKYDGNVFIVAHKIAANGLLIGLLGDQVSIRALNLPCSGICTLVEVDGKWSIADR